MLYVVVDKEGTEKLMLVKANSDSDVESKLKLTSSQEVVAIFTPSEMQALDSASFAVISG